MEAAIIATKRNRLESNINIEKQQAIELIVDVAIEAFSTGLISRYAEEIDDPMTKKMRQLDKLIDELATGKPMEKVLR